MGNKGGVPVSAGDPLYFGQTPFLSQSLSLCKECGKINLVKSRDEGGKNSSSAVSATSLPVLIAGLLII